MEADALIVGAGPAGATAALNLAPFRRVVLIDRRNAPAPRIGELLPGAAWRLLTDMGLWDGFLADGHACCHLHRSLWGDSELVEKDVLRDPDGCGWHLDRARFEARLRATAIARGARMLAPARPAKLEQDDSGWRVAIESSGGPVTVKARLLIDAGGRELAACPPVRRAPAIRQPPGLRLDGRCQGRPAAGSHPSRGRGRGLVVRGASAWRWRCLGLSYRRRSACGI